MSDFAKFCPKCYAFFCDPDLYARHAATCGTAQKQVAERVKEPKKTTGKESAEKTADRRRQTAVKRSQEQGVRSQNTADKGEPSEAGSEISDSCLLTPDSSALPETPVPSAETEPPAKVKPPKFKT